MAQVDNDFVPLDDDSFACVILTDQICSGVCVVDADNTLESEKNRQESDKRNSRVNHLVTSGLSRDFSVRLDPLRL